MIKNDEKLVKIKTLLNSGRILSRHMISEYLKLEKITEHKKMIKNLKMKKVCTKLVPNVFTDEQKDRYMNICQEYPKTKL